MEEHVRWKEKFENYCNALMQLQTALQQKNFSVLEKDGVIKRFEFTFELGWKTLQAKLNYDGYIDVKGPKPVIKQAFNNGIIKDGQDWIDMLTDRNNSTHLYDESGAQRIFDNIQAKWLGLLKHLKLTLENDR